MLSAIGTPEFEKGRAWATGMRAHAGHSAFRLTCAGEVINWAAPIWL